MSKYRFVAWILLIIVLFGLVLTTEARTGIGYCSVLRSRSPGTTGTASNPWPCSTNTNANYARNTMCVLGGGTLYKIIGNGQRTVWKVYTPPCGQQYLRTEGTPVPGGGVDVPEPWLLALGTALAAVLILAGWRLHRAERAR